MTARVGGSPRVQPRRPQTGGMPPQRASTSGSRPAGTARPAAARAGSRTVDVLPRPRGGAAPARRPAGGGLTGGGGPRRPAGVQAGSRGRMGFLTVLVLVVLLAFGGRLVWVQGIRGDEIAAQARQQRLSSYEVLGARGEITDAEGRTLAASVERYDIAVNQKQVGEFRSTGTPAVPDGAAGVAERLAPLLGMSASELGGMLVGDRDFKYIAKNVLPEVARQIRALRLPGITVDKVAERVYPNGDLAGNIVGFVNSNGVGLEGLERSLDDRLTGSPGLETYERGRKGQPIPGGYSAGSPAQQGDSVQLTILSDLQFKAQEALEAAVASTGSEGGTVVVIDTRTGEVLALADSGSVDPNNPGESSGGSLASSVSDVFEPGSTGKVITMAAALDAGLVTPLTQFEVPYTYTTENGETFKDSHEHGLLRLTTTGVLAESSNTGTVMIGQQLPQQTRHDYLTRFGFGSRTGIELPGESPGILRSWETWDSWDRRSKFAVLFGQAVSVTAIQATQVFATIANGGVRVQPHIIKGWTSADGTYTPAPAPATTQVVSPQTAATVLSMMESVVDDGTGSGAAIPGYRVAGKTGTAQNWVNGRQGITASFIGVAPVDSPRIAVSVVLHNPKTSIYGGTVAAPVFSDVAGFALGELGVPPSGSAPQLFPTTW
ncbi:penicillin-binding protein transpeptidase [Cellulomonas fimi ATCC 484]|uniref:Penicillin-binding protein transpeptidase n=3 Tax=Cellulomonas fimi TaxID=1708 RepID=F4H7Q8_CELFA|nr:penicillin-binding protein transpeptidase [Cellulomonas fimi ATCC 484]VEH30463.1 Peptidoglycan synthase FtsI precursor [Cellulomonas fimi]